jgi:hypothetical protein
MAIPLITIAFYLPAFFNPSSSHTSVMTSISILSLLQTAYTLTFVPISAFLPWRRPSRNDRPRSIKDRLLDKEPPATQWYIYFLNSILCIVLAAESMKSGELRKGPPPWLPVALFVVVTVARAQMAPVDTAELERLRYNYKGA